MNSGSEYSANYFEYTVIKKRDKKLKLMRFCYAAGCFLLWVIVTVLLFSFMNGVAAVFVPISMLLCIILLWYLLRFTNIEFDYEISGGDLTMSAVYGGRSRKQLFKKKISEMSAIGRCDDDRIDVLKSKADNVYECISSFDAPEVYYLEFNEKGKKTLVFFETSKKGEKLFKFYNSSSSML